MAIREPYIDVQLGNNKYQKINGVLYQYDHGLKQRIAGLEENRAFSVQYGYLGLKETLSVVPTLEGEFYLADIPDVLLFQNKELQCYVYVEENDSGVTVYEIDMTIMPRTKPADSQYTPQQIENYDALIAEVNDLRNDIQDAIDDAEDVTNKLLNSQATVEMLDPGEDPVATVTQTETSTLFAFQIPKSDVAYATFEVNQEDGCLYMNNSERFVDVSFTVDDNGDLCVEI